MCEDRRLEATPVLEPILASKEPYDAFQKAIVPMRENYNGGLLDPSPVDNLKFSPRVFKDVIRNLYPPASPYRFDVLGVELLGSIYERALGSTITLANDRTVKVELKPELRKAGGVYYTPTWVVDEIVRLAVDPFLKGKTPKDLRTFRVLDPACGSGSFLIAAFERLVRHHEDYYTAHPTVDRRLHFTDSQGVERLTPEAKARILSDSIYGVDVDPAAAEVTTMSLYLKSLESDAPEYIRTQMQISGAILPSLNENIRVGNSLVGTDYYNLQAQLGDLSEEDEHRLRPFRWDSRETGFGKVLADGGFDVVLGNPPYFNVDATYGKKHPVAAYLRRAYPLIWQDKTDVYYYFLAKATALSRGRVAFILSRAFLEADKAQRLRSYLGANARLLELVDLGAYRVFADAGIATAIVDFDATRPHGDSAIGIRRLDGASHRLGDVVAGLRSRSAPFEVFKRKTQLTGSPWRFPNPYRKALFDRLDAVGDPLHRLCVLGQGMQTGANSVFGKLSDADVARLDLPQHLLKQRARNSDVDAFLIRDGGENVLYLEEVDRYDSLPKAVRDYLETPSNKKKLEERAAYQRGDCNWWQYTWPLHKERYHGRRLVSPYRTGHNRFALDSDFTYVSLTDTTVVFERRETPEDFLYIQGLLNSKVLTFRFRGLGKLTSEGMWEAFENSLRELPIRRVDFDLATDVQAHDRVVALVADLAATANRRQVAASTAERGLAARRFEALYDELDQLVLDLYEITDPDERENILALGSPL